MNKIFISSTEEYQPISHGDSYLYENYLRVTTFLKTRIEKAMVERIAKPNLITGNVEWYSEFNGPMSLISEHDIAHQQYVENEYVKFLAKVDRFIKELKLSGDHDKETWANLLSLTFSTENNILISNGTDWAIVWGWKFRNKLNFASPIFAEPQPLNAEEELEVSETDSTSIQKENIDLQESVERDIVETPKDLETIYDEVIIKKRRVGFFGYIKRFFRWISYRFWGLMMLILYTLLVLCICRYCCKKECPDNCSELEKTEHELIKIKERLNERCLSDTL